MKVSAPRMEARGKSLLTPLNLHLAGVVVLLALNAYLAIQIVIALGVAHANDGSAQQDERVRLGAATIAVQPLRGLDKKLTRAKSEAAEFEKTRLPAEQSAVITELGALAQKNDVRLSRVEYTQSATTQPALTELEMDASLSGDYRPLVQFVNGLERDKIFFIINSVTLSGQQAGTVTLKIRVTTWLRAGGNEKPSAASAKEAGQ